MRSGSRVGGGGYFEDMSTKLKDGRNGLLAKMLQMCLAVVNGLGGRLTVASLKRDDC